MSTPIESLSALIIGAVESVSPNEVKILLDISAPSATALNTGVPNPFPRINSYVLIPNETGSLVGIITWIGIEHSNLSKRAGFKDFGIVDLPYPLRKMSITPIGTLIKRISAEKNDFWYELERGVSVFPSVGDAVVLPTQEQLKFIVETHGKDEKLCLGSAPLAADAKVSVDPDKLFGRHLAVLGNTGSGKSCSVAGLIRWSLEAAANERKK